MKSNLIFLICQATKVNKKRFKVEPECEVRIMFVGLGWLELDLRGSRGSEVIVQIPRGSETISLGSRRPCTPSCSS